VVLQEAAPALATLQVKEPAELELAKGEAQPERALARLQDVGRGPVRAEEADRDQARFRESRFKVASRTEAIRQLSLSRSSIRMA
jgi:hypothetical protein